LYLQTPAAALAATAARIAAATAWGLPIAAIPAAMGTTTKLAMVALQRSVGLLLFQVVVLVLAVASN
jgi:hypothetical protein